MCTRPLGKWFGGGDDGRDRLFWHMDLKPYASGVYSIAVQQANALFEDQAQVLTTPSVTYFGIYDGHGGTEASRFVNHHLLAFLNKFALEQGGISVEVIRKAFGATEEEFFKLVKRSWPARPQITSVGSCCLVGAITNRELYVANLGDSRAVLGRRNHRDQDVTAERLTTDHNVNVFQVRREVVELHPDDPNIVVKCQGAWRIMGIIQVSRSIGDVYLKKPEFHRDPLFIQFGLPLKLKRPAMSAEPSIIKRFLKPLDAFLIFASDGLWELLSDQAAVNIVAKYPRPGIARRLVRAALEVVAKRRAMKYKDITRIEKGVRRDYHDDITVIVIYLDQPPASTQARFEGSHCTSAPVDIFSLNANEAYD